MIREISSKILKYSFLLLAGIFFSLSYTQASLYFSLENDGTLAKIYTIDRDVTSTDYISLDFGSTSNRIQYDIGNMRFIVNQAFRVEANVAIVGIEYIAGDHSASDSDGILNLGRNSSTWETFTFDATTDNRFELSNDLAVTGSLTATTLNLDTTPPTYSTGARPTRKVVLSPEYSGATMTGDGGTNSGVMISDFCSNTVGNIPNTDTTTCNTSGDIHNFYSWDQSGGSAADYDIWIRWRVPANFGAWASNPIKVYGKRTDATNNAVTVTAFDTGGIVENSGGTQIAGTSWTETSLKSTFVGTYTAGSYMTIQIHMVSDSGGDTVQVGEISLEYVVTN